MALRVLRFSERVLFTLEAYYTVTLNRDSVTNR